MAQNLTSKLDHGDSEPHLLRSSSEGWKKVCIVCDCGFANYTIFIVDLLKKNNNNSSDSFTPRDPTLLIDLDCFYEAVFCVIGSTLYAFENVVGNFHERGVSKSVFTFDLPDQDIFNLRLQKSMLQTAPPTNHYKFCPRVTPTPDGKKIILFSSLVSLTHPVYDHVSNDQENRDFELYDPVAKSWRDLPNITLPDERHLIGLSYTMVNAFDFVGSSVLLLLTNIGFFTLDFLHGEGWTYLDESYVSLSRVSWVGGMVLIGKEICLTSQQAYDVDPDRYFGLERCFDYPNKTFLIGSNCGGVCSRITRLGCDQFCIVETGIKRDNNKQGVVSLEVYGLDISECTNGYEREKNRTGLLPGATKVKSLKFCYDEPEDFSWFSIIDFSYIPPPLESVV